MPGMNVLIVDDEPAIRELITMTLATLDVACMTAGDITTAKRLLQQGHYGLVLADMYLPDGDGIELVSYMQRVMPQIPVAVITAHGNVENAVNTLKAGAFDYVIKPIDINVLRNLVKTAQSMILSEPTHTAEQQLLGNSPLLDELRQKISKVARSQAPVFISGQSGTGKELVARLIHQQSPRQSQPFIAVNCGAIPAELMESEFFGYRKGSFTGAISDKQGFFQAASGGTLFLDEVADLPLPMQVKLLRAIQEKAIRPIGEQREMSIDVRILSASHKDLTALVNQGDFRQDLFYRINVIELVVPSLRQRREDIPLLVHHILERIARQQGVVVPTITDAALAALQQYNFPGNVRELENILERSMTLRDGNVIQVTDCQLPEVSATVVPSLSLEGLDDIVSMQEKDLIIAALEQHKWNRTQTARALGLSFRQLRYRLKKWQIK